jgi:hypothetical protein
MGAPWRDLPERYRSWKTVASHFYRWQAAGIWQDIVGWLHRQADADGTLDWSLHHVDGTIVRAHQHPAGARKGEGDEALGRSQGGFSTKIPLRAEGGGKPIAILITAGQRHEQSAFEALMEIGAVKRAGRGRPRVRPIGWSGTRAIAAGRSEATCRGGALER